jgi:acetylcholinesterase
MESDALTAMIQRLLIAFSSLIICYGLALVEAAPTATIKNGTYTGLSVPSFKQELFLGMPFAQQPLPPQLRLRPPVSLNSSWAGTRNATEYSPICIGYPSGGSNDDFGHQLSEACLTVNVVRPEGIKEGSNIPVVVWI